MLKFTLKTLAPSEVLGQLQKLIEELSGVPQSPSLAS
jgi:hypothetical protein